MVGVYREVLRDVSQNFEGTENFIKQWIKEACEGKKIPMEEVFCFYIFLVVLVLRHNFSLPFSWKMVLCYCYVNKSLLLCK